MAQQDPPGGPLRRLDPSEPDEPELGRLEPLDPETEELPAAEPPPRRAPRPRNGLVLAVSLAVLLSLSSIAAIAGLVAISVQKLSPAPEPAVTSPIESAADGPTIRVVERASDADRTRDAGREDGSSRAEDSVQQAVALPPAPPAPVAPEPSSRRPGQSKQGQGEDSDRDGGRRSPRSLGGGWCDASPGTTCDVLPGGAVALPAGR